MPSHSVKAQDLNFAGKIQIVQEINKTIDCSESTLTLPAEELKNKLLIKLRIDLMFRHQRLFCLSKRTSVFDIILPRQLTYIGIFKLVVVIF
jgi:ABC-type phosphate/phosphonate transport system ATPase subunit